MLECVTFVLADQKYAIDIMRIREVREVEKLRDVPGAGMGFSGVIEIRKKVIPVFDLRVLFDLPPQNRESDFAVIIVKFGDDRIGYLVDAVTDIEKIQQDAVLNAESYSNVAKTEFIQSVFSIEDNVTIVIDIDRVLSKHGTNSSGIGAAA